jgi:hypothetical protein
MIDDTEKKCLSIVNGFLCNNVTNDDLNRIKTQENLVHNTYHQENTIKTDLFRQGGEWFGTAVRIGTSGIRLITQSDIASTIHSEAMPTPASNISSRRTP